MTIRYDNRVAIVSGAGNGIGKSHAIELAKRGAKVVVNDLGGTRDGAGSSLSAAEAVVQEIKAAGGEAIANGANVAKFNEVQAMIDEAKMKWGRVDILVNNAGILRDKTFAKMELDDFRTVLEVHLMGSVNCCKAAWETMREQNYGRIVLTSSSSGLYGNFGQANYGAAKAAMVGLMNVLHHEGQKFNIKVNTLSPTAATRMTEELLPPNVLQLMQPEAITPAVLYMVSEDAPSRTIMGAGAGVYAVVRVVETQGVYLAPEERTPEAIAAKFAEISDIKTAQILEGAFQQTQKYVAMAAKAAGIDLSKK
jgi:NAD(P)-dependent dehydrogenase (short-subunit alcohol dehydrogenase family)